VEKELIGKKVSFMQKIYDPNFQGTWRQYLYLRKEQAFVFPDDVDFDKIVSCWINPLSVLGIVNFAKKNNHKAIINDAACSALGKILVKYCKKIDLPLINIVRRKEQVEILKELEAEYVLDSSTETFEADLLEIAQKLEATGFFD
jgi:NADPH:quinone reductase